MLRKIVASALLTLLAYPAWAESPNEVLTIIKNEALAANPAFQGFSPANGERFFKQKHGNDWSCSSCHTDSPAAQGKHAKTGKLIQPLAPTANPERFTNPEKVAKWFKRNCNDVLDRVCTPQEKGDVIAYLLTVRK